MDLKDKADASAESPMAQKVVNALIPTAVRMGVTGVTGSPLAGNVVGGAASVACATAPKETALTAVTIGIGIVLLPVCFLMGPVIAVFAAVAVPVQLAYELTRKEPSKPGNE